MGLIDSLKGERSWIKQGDKASKGKDYEEAIRCYYEALKKPADTSANYKPQINYKIGVSYHYKGNYDRAISYYKIALATTSSKSLQIQAQQFKKKAEDSLKTKKLQEKAMAYERIKDYKKAKQVFEELEYWDRAAHCQDMMTRKNKEEKMESDEKKLATYKLQAKKFETAHDYEQAILCYESVGMWEDAGRCRENQRIRKLEELEATGTKVNIGALDQSTSIDDHSDRSSSVSWDDHSDHSSSSKTVIDNRDAVINRSEIGGTSEAAASSETKPKKISICPYCGEDLRFPETPVFCPYCKKQILMDYEPPPPPPPPPSDDDLNFM